VIDINSVIFSTQITNCETFHLL